MVFKLGLTRYVDLYLQVPDGSFWSGRVIFTGTLEGSRQAFTSFEIVDMEIHQQYQKVTFIETDKPLYTPGQEGMHIAYTDVFTDAY